MTQTFEQWAESEGLDMSVDWKGDLTSPVTAGALRGWEAAQSAGQEAVASYNARRSLACAISGFAHRDGDRSVDAAMRLLDSLVKSDIRIYTAPVNGGERELGQVIDERDQYHDAAEKLADAIAKHFGVEIGEHSNLNCPWQNALDHIAQATKRAADAQQVKPFGISIDGNAPTLSLDAAPANMCTDSRGIIVLRNAVASLREFGRYVDEEGEDTDALEALCAALTSPAKVGTVAQVTPEEQAEINAALDRDDELACSSCGLTMAQSRALAAAKVGAALHPAIREGVEAAFDGRDGWQTKIAAAARHLPTEDAKVGGDEREAFEVYLRGIWTQGYGCAKDEEGRYRDGNAQSLWECWRAALSADGAEESPSLTNPLTPYGMLVRALRIVADTTLMEMSQRCGMTPSYLSALEFGRKAVTNDDATSAAVFFASKGIAGTLGLLQAAIAANQAQKGE